MESVRLIRNYTDDEGCTFSYEVPSSDNTACGSSMMLGYTWSRKYAQPMNRLTNQLKIDKQSSLNASHRTAQLSMNAIVGPASNQPGVHFSNCPCADMSAYESVRVRSCPCAQIVSSAQIVSRWHQQSDRIVASIQTPRPFRPRNASSPGALTPGGTGVDVKHGSYSRYLARKKYKRSVNKYNQCRDCDTESSNQYGATAPIYITPSSATWNLADSNSGSGATLDDGGTTLKLDKSGYNPKGYIGPFQCGSNALTTLEFEINAIDLPGGNLNTNVYIVVPNVPGVWDQDANKWIDDGNNNYVNCPELDLIETAGYLGGAMSIHTSNSNLGWGDGADNGGIDKGVQLVSDATASSSNAVWNSSAASNGSYEDGTTIESNANAFRVKLQIDYSAKSLDITYSKTDGSSDILISGGSNFNNLRDKNVEEYKTGIVNDIINGQYGFYVISSVWDTGGDWWACKYNGLTNNGNSSSTGESTIKILQLV